MRAFEDILEFGRVVLPWLGVYAISVTEALIDPAQKVGIEEGVLVAEVIPFLPAHKAGIRKGDIIVRVDGVQVRRPDDLSKYIRKKRIGSVIEVEFVRGRNRKVVMVELEEPPEIA